MLCSIILSSVCTSAISGVGAKKGRDEDWIQHQDAFDEILAGLNKGKREGPTAGTKSIVESAGESKRLQ